MNLHLKSKNTCSPCLKMKKDGQINRVSFNGAPAKFDIRSGVLTILNGQRNHAFQ